MRKFDETSVILTKRRLHRFMLGLASSVIEATGVVAAVALAWLATWSLYIAFGFYYLAAGMMAAVGLSLAFRFLR